MALQNRSFNWENTLTKSRNFISPIFTLFELYLEKKDLFWRQSIIYNSLPQRAEGI